MTFNQLTQIPRCSFFSNPRLLQVQSGLVFLIGFLMINIRTQSKQNDGVAGIQLILFFNWKKWLSFYDQNKFHLRKESFWDYQFNEISWVVINVLWDNMWRTCLFVQIKRCLLVECAKTIVFLDCKWTTCCVFRLLSCLSISDADLGIRLCLLNNINIFFISDHKWQTSFLNAAVLCIHKDKCARELF